MTSARDHIEDLMIGALTRPKPGDLPDSAIKADFQALSPVLEVVMDKVLRKTRIPMFTDDDLVSFMLLKTHQILRQDKWDRSMSPYSFFYVAFLNLMRDIIRRQGTVKASQMRWDILDLHTPVMFDETRYAPPEPAHEEVSLILMREEWVIA